MSFGGRFRSLPLPGGLCGMLGLVMLVELFVALNGMHYTTDAAWSWGISSADSVRRSQDCAVLCFGDSLVKYGVHPRVIEARTGRRAYNLAVLNGPAAASFYLFQRALAAGARPKAVVVDFLPHQLSRDPRFSEFPRAWPELLTFAECMDLGFATHDSSFFASLLTAKVLPSFRARYELRANIVAALAGQSASFKIQAMALRSNWHHQRGGQVEFPGKGRRVPPEHPDDEPLPFGWTANPVTIRYVERFLDLAKASDIQVIWLMPPVTRSSIARRAQLDPAYVRFVEEMLVRYPNACVADARKSNYDRSRFIDAVHLRRTGAATLSNDVAALLETLPASSPADARWFALPDDRPDPGVSSPVRLTNREGAVSPR